jgi:sigma-B regulation protein RsbU (phosphoserine phosphatase)
MQFDIADLRQQIYSAMILIVDDEEINRIFIEKTLRTRGYHNLHTACDGKEALELVDHLRPDMVILDILMPVMDGYECCEMIRAMHDYHDLPILIQTTLSAPEERVAAFSKGATDFISKPIYPDELCARVAVHLERQLCMKNMKIYKDRISEELASACQLQLAILPKLHEIEAIEQQCAFDIASHFQPSSEIGGDFWGIKSLFPNQTALWMVDLSGHGVASALNAFRLQAYLQEPTPLSARPGEYLSDLNDRLLKLLLRGQFATMFYGILDTQGNRLFYACACSPNPIILRRKTGKAELIDGSNKPLGIGMNLYETRNIAFNVGDTLLLYSDAYTEARNDKSQYISEEMMMHLLEEYPDASAAALKEILLDRLQKHTGIALLDDDLTLVIVRRSTGI